MKPLPRTTTQDTGILADCGQPAEPRGTLVKAHRKYLVTCGGGLDLKKKKRKTNPRLVEQYYMTGVRVTSQTQAEILDRLKKKSPNNNRHESGNSDMGPGESSLCRRVLPTGMQAENQGAGIQKTAAQFDHIRGTTQGKPESLLPIFFSLEVFDVKRKKKRRKKEKEEKRKGKKREAGEAHRKLTAF